MFGTEELSYEESREYLSIFEILEKPSPYSMNWYNVHELKAQYIWGLEDEKKPLGFLSYKILIHPNQIDFIYIVKIYVLETHRGENPILINDDRVSKRLFQQISAKGINILTLESACEDLDNYYESLGFSYNKDIGDIFVPIIGTSEQVMSRFVNKIKLSEREKELFNV